MFGDARIKQGVFGRWFIFHPMTDTLAWSGMQFVPCVEGMPTGGVQVCNFGTFEEAQRYWSALLLDALRDVPCGDPI